MKDSLELNEAVTAWVRKAADICGSQKELSRKSGVSYGVMQKYYTGSSLPGSLALLRMAQVTGLSIDGITGVAGETAKRTETYVAPELPPGQVPVEFAYSAARKIEEWLRDDDKYIEDIDFRMELLELWSNELYKDYLKDKEAGLDHTPDKLWPAWLKLAKLSLRKAISPR